MIADMMRLLEEQDYKSDSEANRFLAKLMVSGEPIPKTRPATPLEEAQDLMVRAFGARGKKRIQLARQALEISPDCACATVLLAEEAAKSPAEAVEYYTAGVAAGERALGADFFRKNMGSFWSMIKHLPI